jgi:hypothetical protein
MIGNASTISSGPRPLRQILALDQFEHQGGDASGLFDAGERCSGG